MTEEEKKQLLNAILADDDLARLRTATLNRGLTELRRRRRRNTAARISLIALPVVALAFVMLHLPHPPREDAIPGKQVAFVAPVKRITAEQLLALFPNRPVALVGEPGHRQLVFLDEVPARTASDQEAQNIDESR